MTLPEGLEPFALSTQEKLGELTVEIAPDRLVEACQFLKYHSGFERLSTVTAIDRYPSELRFEVVYHVHSISRNVRLRLKCRLPGASPEIDSVTAVWRSANWYEREVFDLFGIGESCTPGGDLGLGPATAARILGVFGGSVQVENCQAPGMRLTVQLQAAQAKA